MLDRISWDNYFIEIAHIVSQRSICSSRKIGALLVRDKQIISRGYNGPPAGSNLCHDGVCIWPRNKRPSPSDLSGCPAGHAEANCVHQAARVGVATLGATLYASCGVPCKSCLVSLINAGVTDIVCLPETTGIGLYYDKLSQQFVEEGLVKIRILK